MRTLTQCPECNTPVFRDLRDGTLADVQYNTRFLPIAESGPHRCPASFPHLPERLDERK